MKTSEAVPLFEALSSERRLELFKLLVKHAPNGMVACEIAETLSIPANNLSFHLKTLLHSGLCTVKKEGRFLRYQANLPLMLELIAFLTAECCQNNPEECARLRAASNLAECLLPARKTQ